MNKRTTLLTLGGMLAAGALASLTAAPVAAQNWPARPVKMIIPFPPGGTLDTVGRLLAQKLGEQLGQPFVVENRAGGNGSIGSDLVAKAQPDGHTMLFNASTFVTAPMTMAKVPYSVIKDFTPVALVAKAPLSVAINRNLAVTDVRSLLAHAKAQQGRMTFAVGSIGSAGHLATELLKKSGMDYTVIPYKGTAPAFQDLIGGQIDGFIDPILGSVQHHKAGRVRVVAVTSLTRVPNLPDVPAVSETIPGYEFYSWYGVWGPAGLPDAIRDRLNAEVNKALRGEMKDRLTPQGLLVTPGSVADFVKFQTEDMARAQKLITEGKIRVN
jgi:tripartite-type tricarboxylate transporter receptor subunit TctC